jgi:hypothetical protein
VVKSISRAPMCTPVIPRSRGASSGEADDRARLEIDRILGRQVRPSVLSSW